jgi:2-oxoglutarate dehydrogenase E2 component (dihydrolipoamide succinyltransferase)
MAVEITLPELGESVEGGTLVAWLVAEGDTVTAGQAIAEISTDKVDTEVPSPNAGRVTRLVAAVDDEVAVGGVLLELELMEEGEGPATTPAPSPVPEPATERATESATEPAVAPAPEPAAAPVSLPGGGVGDLVEERRQEGVGIEVVVDRDPVDREVAGRGPVISEFGPPGPGQPHLHRLPAEQFSHVAGHPGRQPAGERRGEGGARHVIRRCQGS